jgi:hypothetical protein
MKTRLSRDSLQLSVDTADHNNIATFDGFIAIPPLELFELFPIHVIEPCACETV